MEGDYTHLARTHDLQGRPSPLSWISAHHLTGHLNPGQTPSRKGVLLHPAKLLISNARIDQVQPSQRNTFWEHLRPAWHYVAAGPHTRGPGIRFGFKTPIPYPFGLERTGYLVTDMDEAVRGAKATGAEVLVPPSTIRSVETRSFTGRVA
jgi:hypothetical protein